MLGGRTVYRLVAVNKNTRIRLFRPAQWRAVRVTSQSLRSNLGLTRLACGAQLRRSACASASALGLRWAFSVSLGVRRGLWAFSADFGCPAWAWVSGVGLGVRRGLGCPAWAWVSGVGLGVRRGLGCPAWAWVSGVGFGAQRGESSPLSRANAEWSTTARTEDDELAGLGMRTARRLAQNGVDRQRRGDRAVDIEYAHRVSVVLRHSREHRTHVR